MYNHAICLRESYSCYLAAARQGTQVHRLSQMFFLMHFGCRKQCKLIIARMLQQIGRPLELNQIDTVNTTQRTQSENRVPVLFFLLDQVNKLSCRFDRILMRFLQCAVCMLRGKMDGWMLQRLHAAASRQKIANCMGKAELCGQFKGGANILSRILYYFPFLINNLMVNPPMIGLNWIISACNHVGIKILLTLFGS